MSLPLHEAFKAFAPAKVCFRLLAAYSDAALQRDELNRIPLHYAAAARAPSPVVDAMLGQNSLSASYYDDQQATPLHLAVGASLRVTKGAEDITDAAAEKNQLQIVLALIKASPKSVHELDSDRLLPLHHAVGHRSSDMVVQALVRAFPK